MAISKLLLNIAHNLTMFKGVYTYVCEREQGMWDWGEPKRMTKSGLFGIRLVKHMPSIASVFFFEVLIRNW